jgi:DNA-binding IclR family transcriptional regulator
MTKTSAPKPAVLSATSAPKTKNQLVIDALSRDDGVTLDEMSSLAGWLPHSTRSFMTGLQKKGYVIESNKVDGERRYRIIAIGAA